MNDKPVVLLDVDGVLNCLGVGEDEARERGLIDHDAVAPDGHAYRLLIDPETPRRLALLQGVFEVVWCTTWQNANKAIAPLVGLDGEHDGVWLPREFVDIPLHFGRKVPFICRWAAQRGRGAPTRLAWLDDETDVEADTRGLSLVVSESAAPRLWQQALAGTPPLEDVLLIPADPSAGLTDEHVATLLAWASR